MVQYVKETLGTSASVRRFAYEACARLSPPDRSLTEEIMQAHRAKMHTAAAADREKRARSFLKPLRGRKAARVGPRPLEPAPAPKGPPTFHAWLSGAPEKERMRDISKSQRPLQGISKWPLQWLKGRGVVCYERAEGRILAERGGRPDAEFLKGVVKTRVLPTAVANASDHYIVVARGERPRFMTVEEVARGFGIPAACPLMAMLAAATPLSCNVAVDCLGRSIHVVSATRIVKMLAGRGLLARGLRYGSAYSGIDAAWRCCWRCCWPYSWSRDAAQVGS